ncbi:hypothetical protein HK102_013929 [Quaeritorhiza haematococci]|nr:hypothetical protein HK102_013929 [Quaeritorhiza haematococci]
MKMHGLVRLLCAIPLNGSPSGYDAAVNEESHKADAKAVYRKTNRKDAEAQMLNHLERRDKMFLLQARITQTQQSHAPRMPSSNQEAREVTADSKTITFLTSIERRTTFNQLAAEDPERFRGLEMLIRTKLDNDKNGPGRLPELPTFDHGPDYDEDGDRYVSFVRSTSLFHGRARRDCVLYEGLFEAKDMPLLLLRRYELTGKANETKLWRVKEAAGFQKFEVVDAGLVERGIMLIPDFKTGLNSSGGWERYYVNTDCDRDAWRRIPSCERI